MKKVMLLCGLILVITTSVFGWEGYDYEESEYSEIEEGNLVRSGEEIGRLYE